MQSRKKKEQYNLEHPKFGCFLFGGAGLGGNDPQRGLAYGGNFRIHYLVHTLNFHVSQSTKSEQIKSPGPETEVLNSKCYGFTYGVGSYGKNISFSVGAGIGHSETLVYRGFFGTGRYIFVNYNETGLCVGTQLSFHGRFIGLTLQGYSIKSRHVLNYSFLVGLEFIPSNLISAIRKFNQ